jgi:hypothetical protein
MDEASVLLWMRRVWGRRDGALRHRPSLLVWDQFRSHLTEKVKRALKEENVTQAVIPGGLTGILQPLDVSLNKPFKVVMRRKWVNGWQKASAGRLPKVRFVCELEIIFIYLFDIIRAVICIEALATVHNDNTFISYCLTLL